MGSVERQLTDFDVVIVGAGISGINSAYRVQTEFPGYSYTILESRGAIGGTWDLFRYPGIRSDSDLYTFGFPWRPWLSKQSIADGPSIRNYMRESAEQYGIDGKIRFHTKLVAADWSSSDQSWRLSVKSNGGSQTLRARFIIFGTGYYSYDEPLETTIPGLEDFEGTKVLPQFWPEGLDYANKKMVIIGSGATAVTLLPVLAEKASKVTMLQRTPSFVLSLPAVDPAGDWLRKYFPASVAYTFLRWKFLIIPWIVFRFCRSFPNAARKVIKHETQKLLPASISHDPNFSPPYNPWEQRLCLCPDGDFYTALRSGKADVVTDTIKTITAKGIETSGGRTLEADIIVQATGLKLQLAGGAQITIDGKPFAINEKFLWRGAMLQDLPNAAFIIGYTNASWTLGAVATATLICRLLKHMEKNKIASAVPRISRKMTAMPVLNLSSTYIDKAKGTLPKAGDTAPWKPRSNYFIDSWRANWGSLDLDMQFTEQESQKKVN